MKVFPFFYHNFIYDPSGSMIPANAVIPLERVLSVESAKTYTEKHNPNISLPKASIPRSVPNMVKPQNLSASSTSYHRHNTIGANKAISINNNHSVNHSVNHSAYHNGINTVVNTSVNTSINGTNINNSIINNSGSSSSDSFVHDDRSLVESPNAPIQECVTPEEDIEKEELFSMPTLVW